MIVDTSMINIAICFTRQIALPCLWRSLVDDVSSILFCLIMNLCRIAVSWIGFMDCEGRITAFTFEWLIAKAGKFILLRLRQSWVCPAVGFH